MTVEQIILLAISILVAVLCIAIAVSIKKFKKSGSFRERIQELEDEQLNVEPETLTVHAKVVDMTCGVHTYGTKIPKVEKYFAVQFQKDDGDVLSILVPEDCYDGFEIGLCGTLSLIDGKLNSFAPDEALEKI